MLVFIVAHLYIYIFLGEFQLLLNIRFLEMYLDSM